MKLKIDVEKYHIENGHPKSAELNPLALALGPRLPVGEVETTSDGYVQFYETVRRVFRHQTGELPFFMRGERLAQFPLPPDAAEYVHRCAQGEKPEPRSFEIEVPDGLLKGAP